MSDRVTMRQISKSGASPTEQMRAVVAELRRRKEKHGKVSNFLFGRNQVLRVAEDSLNRMERQKLVPGSKMKY